MQERRNNMKAPDKVYIDDLAVVNDCVTKISLKQLPNFSKYIRKDALLEWAKELKERWEEPPMSRHSPGCVYMLEQLINKLNSM